MKRWFFVTLAVVILAFGIGAAVGSNSDRHGNKSEVITTASGDTVVVTPGGRGGFPFFFLLIPIGILAFLAFSNRGRRWGNGCPSNMSEPKDPIPANASTEADRDAQWRAWHDAQHARDQHPMAPAQ